MNWLSLNFGGQMSETGLTGLKSAGLHPSGISRGESVFFPFSS